MSIFGERSDQVAEVGIRIPDEGLPRAETANFFHCVQVEGEVQLLCGTVPLQKIEPERLREAARRAEPIRIEGDITHRFLLSLASFDRLRRALNEVYDRLPPSLKTSLTVPSRPS
jgi:hypothetical protein